jgi:hypothetical protein
LWSKKRSAVYRCRLAAPRRSPGGSEARADPKISRRNPGDDLAVAGGADGLQLACSCHLSPARAGQLAFKAGGKMNWCIRQDLNLQPSDPKSEALSN